MIDKQIVSRPKFPLIQRVEYLKNMCRGKKILHLGCTNHPYTETSIINGTNLHFDLMKIAEKVYGFDYDQSGIDMMASHGVKDLYFADLENLAAVPLDEKFDLIIAGEMIEHLSNPGLFLKGIQRFMTPSSNLVITTINAYCGYRYFVYGLKGRGGTNEPVHQDHVSYYSYSTLNVVLRRANLKIDKFAFVDVGVEHRPFLNWRQRLANDITVSLSNMWADGVLAECSLAQVES